MLYYFYEEELFSMADTTVNEHRKPNGDFGTKYYPARCEELIAAMSDGASVTEAAFTMKVTLRTLHNWRDKHPKFAEAWARAHEASLVWWEKTGRDAAAGKLKGSATHWSLTMKNRFGWRDSFEQTITQISTNVNVSLSPEEEETFRRNYDALFGKESTPE